MFVTTYWLKLITQIVQAITFTKKEVAKVVQPHNDALVLTLKFSNYNVHRILVDNESLIDVYFRLAYNQMSLPPKVLKSTNTFLYRFLGCNIQPIGKVKLPMTINSHSSQATVFTNFLVIDILLVYNVIIGHPTLKALQVVASIYYLAIKFSITIRVGVIQGNQVKVRRYFALAMKENGSNPNKLMS